MDTDITWYDGDNKLINGTNIGWIPISHDNDGDNK